MLGRLLEFAGGDFSGNLEQGDVALAGRNNKAALRRLDHFAENLPL
jgi:hypothetical protein